MLGQGTETNRAEEQSERGREVRHLHKKTDRI